MVPEFSIPIEAPTKVPIRRLAARVCKARDQMDNVQLELNLQITKLQLKAQPSTPPEVREECASTITSGM